MEWIFRRLSGKLTRMTVAVGKRLVVLGLVVFSVGVLGEGCSSGPPICPAGTLGPYDNRDRTFAPHTDQDWICFVPLEPLPAPDLGGDRPIDLPGPKNMEATAKAAIFIETCLRNTIYESSSYPSTNTNERIDRLYRTVYSRSVQRAFADRVGCFLDKTNGCDAVFECLGVLVIPDDPRYADGCYGDIAMSRTEFPPFDVRNVWTNCKGLGLECRDGACVLPRELCNHTTEMPFCTDDGAPRNCDYDGPEDAFFRVLEPSCARWSLECSTETAADAECAGAGPACTPSTFPWGTMINYHDGIECVDATNLRTCVNGREHVINCATLGEGFKCIGGTHPQCGADFQCDYDGEISATSCVDDTIEVCNAGVTMQFDCRALGFDSCYGSLGACIAKPVEVKKP